MNRVWNMGRIVMYKWINNMVSSIKRLTQQQRLKKQNKKDNRMKDMKIVVQVGYNLAKSI